MDEFLTEEEQQKILLIQRYEDGDTSLEEKIIDILAEIYYFSKYDIPKIIVQYSLTILYNKVMSYLCYGKIEETSTLYTMCDETFTFFKKCAKTLKEYLKVGFKKDEFSDLESAYRLTFYINGLLYNIDEYLDEIITLESVYVNNYDYYPRPNIYSKCEERRGKVKSLIDLISPNNEHEKI